ncbi:MAG: hypothetical protein WAK31_15455 [Chthoniobacterales bacterium]
MLEAVGTGIVSPETKPSSDSRLTTRLRLKLQLLDRWRSFRSAGMTAAGRTEKDYNLGLLPLVPTRFDAVFVNLRLRWKK